MMTKAEAKKLLWACSHAGGNGNLSAAAVKTILGLVAPWQVYIAADGTLWQDSARTSPVTADGQSIGSADDGSGNNYNALQAGAGKPVFKQNIFGSLPGMLFTAASSQYLQTAAFAAALTQPVTVLFSAKPTSVASPSRRMIDGSSANNFPIGFNSTPSWQCGSGTILTGGTADTNVHVFAALYNSTATKLYVDGGTAVLSGNSGTNTLSKLTIGINGGLINAAFDGYILDILVLPYLATLSQINTAGPLMAARAGTVWTPAV